MQEMETHVCSLGQKVPLEQEMATQSHILAWKNARAEEPGGLQSMGLHRVWQDRVNEHTSSGNILYGMLLNWDLSHVFLVVKLELQVLGKKIIQKSALLITSYQRNLLSTWLIRFLYCKVIIFPLFSYYSLRKSQCMVHTKGMESYDPSHWEWRTTWIIWNSSTWETCLFFFLYLLTYLLFAYW